MRGFTLLTFGVLLSTAVCVSPGVAGASADTGSSTAAAAAIPSAMPSLDRPQYAGDKAVVYGIGHVGDQVIVGGSGITSIIQGDGTTIAGTNLSATAPGDPTHVTWTAPGPPRAQWWDIQPLSDGHDFIAVGTKGVWRFDLRSQAAAVWHHPLNGTATTVSRVPGTRALLVGGRFPSALIALSALNGKRSGYVLPKVSGRMDVPNAGPTKVYRGEVSPDGRWYVGLGMFTRVGVRHREQAFELRLGPDRARVAAWRPPVFEKDPNHDGYVCGQRLPQFLRDVSWSADSKWFAIVSTGGNVKLICDSASQWTPTSNEPVWISPTCIDTIHSDLVIGGGPTAVILVSGHFKCIGTSRGLQGSPEQEDRFGIALLNADGSVNPWRSDKCRGVGGRVLAEVPGGYAVGYDCGFWGNSEKVNPEPTPQFPRSRYAFLPSVP